MLLEASGAALAFQPVPASGWNRFLLRHGDLALGARRAAAPGGEVLRLRCRAPRPWPLHAARQPAPALGCPLRWHKQGGCPGHRGLPPPSADWAVMAYTGCATWPIRPQALRESAGACCGPLGARRRAGFNRFRSATAALLRPRVPALLSAQSGGAQPARLVLSLPRVTAISKPALERFHDRHPEQQRWRWRPRFAFCRATRAFEVGWTSLVAHDLCRLEAALRRSDDPIQDINHSLKPVLGEARDLFASSLCTEKRRRNDDPPQNRCCGRWTEPWAVAYFPRPARRPPRPHVRQSNLGHSATLLQYRC